MDKIKFDSREEMVKFVRENRDIVITVDFIKMEIYVKEKTS